MSTGKNKYYVRSHISERLFRRSIRIIALELTACEVAAMTGLSVRSVNTIYLKWQTHTREEEARLDNVSWMQQPKQPTHLP
jgi:hypothetical protein